MVAVHAGLAVERKSVVFASLGTHLGGTTEEGLLAFEGGVMCISAARAHFGVEDDLQDVRGTQLGYFAPVNEQEVVGFKILWWYRGCKGGGVVEERCSGWDESMFVNRRSIQNRFDSHVQGGEIEVKKRRICL